VFKKTNKHNELGKTLLKTQRIKKRLEKPLEKVHAEKIQRAVGYEKTKTQLNRWDAIVAKNAMADQLVFPLHEAGADLEMGTPKTLEHFRFKSDLMKTMEALMPAKEPDDDKPSEFALTLDEMKEKAKELAKIRMRESYKMAKGRRQNKIKSKKFHRLMKRDKVKQQLKDFDQLQKTDPDAALRKLEQIERQRALERTSLRHKNTGSWAQNLQVRAKYDENARKELAEQLTISRELTQKQLVESESEMSDQEEADNRSAPKLDPSNPWMRAQLSQSGDDIENFVSGYRKYWNDRNKNEKAMEEFKSMEPQEVVVESSSSSSEDETNLEDFKTVLKENKATTKSSNGWLEEDASDGLTAESDSDDEQSVEEKTIEAIFDDVEDDVEQKIARKLKKIRQDLDDDDEEGFTSKKRKKGAEGQHDLSFKKTAKRPMLDEALNAEDQSDVLESLRQKIEPRGAKKSEDEINPGKFVQIKPKHLLTALPDEVANVDEEDDEGELIGDRRLTIAEAFEDDDIVADFEQEKQDELDRSKPKDIDLTLPGWGSWGGAGLQNRKPKKKLVIKAPTTSDRKDQAKDRIIINEVANAKMKEHLVRDLPFPFTSVKDYEASIRTPVGRTFVPETAHRLLTKPAVVTKMGHIIRPMDESTLVQKKRMRGFTKTGAKVAALEKEEAEMSSKK
jgi:U3 small nucleolar RNA-associated protein 14